MSARLTLEELDFYPVDTRAELAANGYYFEVGADDTEFGNAEAVVSSLLSEMFEGASYEVTGYEGVEVPVMVRITGVDSAAVATGAAELIKVCRREAMKALTYTPPDGTAPPTVFDVLVATWQHRFDDFDETRPRRAYLLKLYCKPFSRSADLVTIPAVSIATAAPTITSIDNGSSTTGWTTGSKAVSRINLVTNASLTTGIHHWYKGTNTSKIEWDSGGWLRVRPVNRSQRAYVNYGQAPRPVVAGQSYRIYMDLWQNPGTSQLGFLYRWFNASGNQIGADATVTASLAPLGSAEWRNISTTRTAPTGATGLWIFPFGVAGNLSESVTHYNVDHVHIELNSTWTGTWFDGNSTPSGSTEYVWPGATGASTSYAITPAAVTTSSGSVRVTAYAGRGRGLNLRRAGTIDLSTAKWLRLRGVWSGTLSLNVEVPSGEAVPAIAPQVVVRSGSSFDAYFPVPVDSITAFTLSTNAAPAELQSSTLSIDQVDTSTGLPLTGTGRSGDFQAEAYGTMPAEATIEVANTADLGRMVLLYTRPAALASIHPALRARRIAGPSVTAASTNISGFSEVLTSSQSGAVTWEIDAAYLPMASYLLAARLTASGLTSGNGYVLNWRSYMVLDGTTESTIHTGSRTIKAAATTYGNTFGQRITEIGLLTLPTQNVYTSGDASAKVRIQMWVTGGGTWTLDESWIFDVDKGDLSVVEPASALRRLRVTPASADRPTQTYIAENEVSGNVTARDVSDEAIGWTQHKVDPRDGEVAIYVATLTDTPALSAEVEYYPRWDVYAAPIEIEATA